jgi:hypothetical protein
MDAEEDGALTTGDDKGADVSTITDADVEHNPFPRAQPAIANKKSATLASERRTL